jgi:hypothetical protein
MDQLHKRFTVEQVKVLFQGYCQGTMSRAEVEEMLNIGKTHFFALLKEYRQSPPTFSIAYERGTPARLPRRPRSEKVTEKELVTIRNYRFRLQLLCPARPSEKDRPHRVGDHHHGSGQEAGVLQTSPER